MEDWVPYEKVRNHPPDFRIKYRLYSEAEGGRKNSVFQGLRCDFAYGEDDIKETGIFAIHPEFEDDFGNIVLNRSIPVPKEGTAKMWILFSEMRREVHFNRIKVGVIGYFMEGSKKIGQVEVIEILGLNTNVKTLSDRRAFVKSYKKRKNINSITKITIGVVLVCLGSLMVYQNHFVVSWSIGLVILVGLVYLFRGLVKLKV